MDTSELNGPIMGPLVPPGTGEGPRDLGFTSEVSGGATQVTLVWETLLESAQRLGRATEVSSHQGEVLSGVNRALLHSGSVVPHWRLPLLGVRCVALAARCLLVNQLLQEGVRGVNSAYESYRSAESQIHRWFHLGTLYLEAPYIIEHLVHEDGDKGLAGDWARSMATLGGIEAFRLLSSRFTRTGRSREHNTSDMASVTGFLAIKVLNDHKGLGLYEMDRNVMDLGEQTQQFKHQGDGTLHSWYEQMADVTDHGDLAVTAVTDDGGSTSYLVHLPGMDLDLSEPNREDGRGYLGLVDAVFNDSDHLAEVVDQALEAAGADSGDTIAVSGYSLGGIGATNLVRSGTLQQKYDFRSSTSIGGAGRDTSLPEGTSTTHIQDRRDPVPHILGERHQESSDRIIVDVAHHNEEIQSEGAFGGAHTYQHYLDIIEELEQNPEEHFSAEDQKEHFDSFAELYSGGAETTVFETRWSENANPENLFPHEREIFDVTPLRDLLDDSLAPVLGEGWLQGEGWCEGEGGEARDPAEVEPVQEPPPPSPPPTDPDQNHPDEDHGPETGGPIGGGQRIPESAEVRERLTPGVILEPETITPTVTSESETITPAVIGPPMPGVSRPASLGPPGSG